MNFRKIIPYIVQSSIYLFEIFLIIVIVNSIFAYFFPIKDFFDYFSRSLGIYTVYQLFIYSTLKLANDAKKDSYSTLKYMYESALLLIEIYGNDYATYFILSIILKNHINLQLHNSVFNMEEVREKYIKLIENIDKKNIFSIKFEINSINQKLALLNQEFFLSIFLRLLKTSLPIHVKQYMGRYNNKNNDENNL